jgi:hypothetical protein
MDMADNERDPQGRVNAMRTAAPWRNTFVIYIRGTPPLSPTFAYFRVQGNIRLGRVFTIFAHKTKVDINKMRFLFGPLALSLDETVKSAQLRHGSVIVAERVFDTEWDKSTGVAGYAQSPPSWWVRTVALEDAMPADVQRVPGTATSVVAYWSDEAKDFLSTPRRICNMRAYLGNVVLSGKGKEQFGTIDVFQKLEYDDTQEDSVESSSGEDEDGAWLGRRPPTWRKDRIKELRGQLSKLCTEQDCVLPSHNHGKEERDTLSAMIEEHVLADADGRDETTHPRHARRL